MNLIYMTKLQDNKTDPNTVLVINKLLRLLLQDSTNVVAQTASKLHKHEVKMAS
jgi:translation initiation factor IF-1